MRIHHYRYIRLHGFGRLANFPQPFPVGIEVAVGEIQARHIHARGNHFSERRFAVTCRPNCGDDFGFTKPIGVQNSILLAVNLLKEIM